jgi:hypothetical protein
MCVPLATPVDFNAIGIIARCYVKFGIACVGFDYQDASTNVNFTGDCFFRWFRCHMLQNGCIVVSKLIGHNVRGRLCSNQTQSIGTASARVEINSYGC